MIGTIKVHKAQGKTFAVKPQFNKYKTIVIYASGSPREKAGYCFWEFTVFADNEQILKKSGVAYESKITHAVAHYVAIIEAFKWIAANCPMQSVEVINCYENNINVFNGEKKRAAQHLKKYDKLAKGIQAKTNATLTWMSKEMSLNK